MKLEMYRQGDLLMIRTWEPLSNKTPNNSPVILKGEFWGHAHQIVSGLVYGNHIDGMFLEANKDAKIIHEEHDTINLPKGNYRVVRQREFVPKSKNDQFDSLENFRYVID